MLGANRPRSSVDVLGLSEFVELATPDLMREPLT